MRVFVIRFRWQYMVMVLLLAFFAALPQMREPLIMAVMRGRLLQSIEWIDQTR